MDDGDDPVLDAVAALQACGHTVEALGVEDALSYCLGAAIIAAMLTWVLSP